MEAVKYYKKYVVENKNLVFVSIAIALFFRVCIYFLYTNPVVYPYIEGFLWTDAIRDYLAANKDISALLSFAFTVLVVLYSAYLNNKHKLIRSRTYLIYTFTILLFSIHPATIYMSPQYISLLLLLVCMDILLDGYQQSQVAGKAYSIGFVTALASLFSFGAFIYLPLFWIGAKMMRCLNVKNIVTSLIGVVSVYWIIFFYYLWQKDLDSFLHPFIRLYPPYNGYVVNNVDFIGITLLACCAILTGITAMSYFRNSYQDKIQIRANLYLFYVMTLFSLLAFIFIDYDPTLNLFVFLSSSSILFSHFFSLILKKWKVSLFYLCVILCFMAYIYLLFNKAIMTLLPV